MNDYTAVLNEIEQEVRPHLSEGKVASYIPELASVALEQFGMALVDSHGEIHTCGAAQEPWWLPMQFSVFFRML